MTEAQQRVKDYMTGYCRNNKAGLDSLAQYPRWQQVAEAELQRRDTRFIACMTDEDLIAIASGEVDIAKMAKTMQASQ
jgi:hypothetical protein